MGPFNWDGRLYFPRKNWRPFFSHYRSPSVCQLSVLLKNLATFFLITVIFTRGRPFSGLHKIAAPSVRAPARPNMLNMPKYAAGLYKLLLLRYNCTFLRINLLLVGLSLFDNTAQISPIPTDYRGSWECCNSAVNCELLHSVGQSKHSNGTQSHTIHLLSRLMSSKTAVKQERYKGFYRQIHPDESLLELM